MGARIPPRTALALLALASALLTLVLRPAVASAQSDDARGTKEVVLDSLSDFNHTNATLARLWKGNERVQENGADPIGYFYDKADISDPNIVLSAETNGYINRITTQQRPVPNWYMPPEPGELRLAGWKVLATTDGRVTSDAASYRDSWNDWSARTPDPDTGVLYGVSHPIGGMNYILQSFKVYKTGMLSKLRIKVRRHPGVGQGGANPGIYVAILADDPAGAGTRPKTYASGSVMKEVVLGHAHVADGKIGPALDDGSHEFKSVDVIFRDIDRPMLVADKLYWMKISTMPYAR